jgi:UDP-N-acetylglucosamine 2-epimerase
VLECARGDYAEKILDCTHTLLDKANKWQNPFGDGTAGERLVELIGVEDK